jgi:hypothetical protein
MLFLYVCPPFGLKQQEAANCCGETHPINVNGCDHIPANRCADAVVNVIW